MPKLLLQPDKSVSLNLEHAGRWPVAGTCLVSGNHFHLDVSICGASVYTPKGDMKPKEPV